MKDENAGKTVREILHNKKGLILKAPLDAGSPSWDDIMDMTWEEIVRNHQMRIPGFKKFHKLLKEKRFDR